MLLRSAALALNRAQYLEPSLRRPQLVHIVTYMMVGKRARAEKRPFAAMAQSSNGMIDAVNFEKLRGDMQHYDEKREIIIKRSRDVQKLAKQAIYSLHRGQSVQAQEKIDTAGAMLLFCPLNSQHAKHTSQRKLVAAAASPLVLLLSGSLGACMLALRFGASLCVIAEGYPRDAEKTAQELLPLIEQHSSLRPGSYSASMEELAEARVFMVFLQHGRLATTEDIPMADREEYLGGVLDFAGELNRFAVARATVRDMAAVQQCRDLVDGLMGQFLQFDLRNGSLRKKFDSLKYTLRKLENTLYELSLGRPEHVETEEEEHKLAKPDIADGDQD